MSNRGALMNNFPTYHKINSIYKRDMETNRFIMGDWANEAIGYLAELPWQFTEKIDGTNVRVGLKIEDGCDYVTFGGRTDRAQMPKPLEERLQYLFSPYRVDLAKVFGDSDDAEMVLYGEGYGAGIQKGGAYGPVDFILFDVRVGQYWLEPKNVRGIADTLGLRMVPSYGVMSLTSAIERVRLGMITSSWSGVEIEGLVGTPTTQLFDRFGQRVIAKIKGVDFREAK